MCILAILRRRLKVASYSVLVEIQIEKSPSINPGLFLFGLYARLRLQDTLFVRCKIELEFVILQVDFHYTACN